MIEKRNALRHRVFKGATLTYDGGDVACTVRNISTGGAGIEIHGSVFLPRSFKLSISVDKFARECRTVWRSDNRIGLAFLH
jgi:hypothetical protein